MAEFNLDRFKYRWRGNWDTGIAYRRDDIVRVNGKSYVCIITHTSSSTFRDDLNAILPDSDPPQPQPRWVVMTSGKSYIGDWAQGTAYNLGDLVTFNGSVYQCTKSHTGGTFSSDASGVELTAPDQVINWVVFALGQDFVGNWLTATDYGLNALVKYNGIVYRCIKPHTSQSQLEDNESNWTEFHTNIEYRSVWLPSTQYRKNDIIKYGGSLFRCTETHTSGLIELDDTKFVIEFPGYQFDAEWNSTTVYNVGDIVRYGGYLYYAVQNNLDDQPSRSQETDTSDSTQNWILLSKNYNFVGDWSITGAYKTGDVVQRGGQLFKALQDINLSGGDGSSADYLDDEIWERLSPGKIYSGSWITNRLYSVGEVVYYLGNSYVCNFEHESTTDNFPGDNGSGYVFWDLLIQAGEPGGLQSLGDLLTYGKTRTIVGDDSSLGPVRVPIGEQQQVLSVSSELEVFWRNIINDSDTIFVSTNGVDDDGYGTNQYRPFRTIKHACEYVEDNFDPLTPVKVYVSTGRYEEVGPITIPAGCVVMGDELRSTTIVATGPKTSYSGNYYTYHKEAIDHVISIIADTLNNVPVDAEGGNNVVQNLNSPPTDIDAINVLVNKIADYENYIEFRTESGSIDPTLTGSNTLSSNSAEIGAADGLLLNQNFLVEDAYRNLVRSYPAVTFDKTQVINDLKRLFRGLARDTRYSGNYLTLISARHFANSVLGSKRDDLFWVRDTTGLRNCTTDGLTGTLNPPGVFAQYQRPTGGACVALDPGWGPDDSRTWINNRSPYIQGVTNLGTACVGKKIDGSLHNGGNRSMVSNDFTQVLSDGIGAWVLNNARAELVSVFTYYCQVGYLAEDGGIIRATNGNNSYGSFGSIAEGVDPNEVPIDATVNNRQNEAQVKSAIAGQSNDEIILFEYTHCGEEYTEAVAEITGAGADANVAFTDFRDGALFNARLINTTGSGSEGGSNYLVRQNSAQNTIPATDRIILNTNDETQFESEILGMRLLIVSGTGVGQYGYVSAYNPATTTVTVRKESDNTLGWDHVIPGYPIETDLDSTTVYRIEPRIVANHPGFSNNFNYNLSANRTWIDSAFGGTTAFYTNLTADAGSGAVDGITPVAATFNITRRGTAYTVVNVNKGAGYAVGDIITYEGTALGGATPDNDVVITVTDVSDDSTNEILDFTFTGTARGGRFVALAEPNFAAYSDDGQSWTETNISFVGTYTRIIAANDRFIALANNENRLSFSYNGVDWTTRSLPSTGNWIDGAYGNGTFVLISENSNEAAYGTDGLNWTISNLPTGDDSTGDQWQGIAYGQGRFVAITGSQTRDVAYSPDGITWTRYNQVLPAGDYNWINLEFGNNRFLAFASDGSVAYSVDKGQTWIAGADAPSLDGSTSMVWKDIKYAQGVFVAICDTGAKEFGEPAGQTQGPTTLVATTEDGILWRTNNVQEEKNWGTLAFASLNNVPTWVLLAQQTTNNGIAHVLTGAQAKVRADVTAGSFESIKIWDPGSGYSDSNPVEFTITDNQFVSEVETTNRLGNRVIAQPEFINRGTGYRTSTSSITITGDGFADIVPESNTLVLQGIPSVPGPGVQIKITGILNEATPDPDDLLTFTGVSATDLGDDGTGNNTRLVQFTLSPSLKNEYNLAHSTAATLQTRYSQCRVSGHDFLDIGTGNFEQTNYPELYAGGAFFVAAPENEVLEVDGGKVYYVSTDQDGNFRTGELFGVDQATGIVTISAEFFDLDGLSELSLGGVRLGGTGTVVNEFSTDPTFSADSNSVIPTQKAIATFLADRLSVGGSDLQTNALTAGQVFFGSNENIFETTGDTYLNIPRVVDFSGQDALGNATAIQGTIISQMLLFRNFNDTVQ